MGDYFIFSAFDSISQLCSLLFAILRYEARYVNSLDSFEHVRAYVACSLTNKATRLVFAVIISDRFVVSGYGFINKFDIQIISRP